MVPMLRALLLGLFAAMSTMAAAQRIDSVHVFKKIPPAAYTSASANALAWRLHKEDAPHRTVRGKDIGTVREALSDYKPSRHTYAPLADLTHLAIVFSAGRPVAFGVTGDLDRVINFTARTEYRISTWTEHLRVRALLTTLLVE
ncbi:MAG: hypothetical protein JNL43_06220 [Flavobacteriales bacterium]|nr:hypothetical protein [Flavobacteriales bacterium]